MNFTVGDLLGPIDRNPDEIQMFSFAAAVWNQHRIHYDRDGARSEGHKDSVVENMMRATWLSQLVHEYAGPRVELTRLHYRHVAPAYVNQHFTISGTVKDVDATTAPPTVHCEVKITGPDGDVTRGSASFHVS